jgi:hypothetical protein
MSIIDNIQINQNFGEKATKSIDEQRKDGFKTTVYLYTAGKLGLEEHAVELTNLNIVAEDAMGFQASQSDNPAKLECDSAPITVRKEKSEPIMGNKPGEYYNEITRKYDFLHMVTYENVRDTDLVIQYDPYNDLFWVAREKSH